jgi:hypothetical protein
MELLELKSAWNDVLDELESTNRIAWLVFFDARLAKLENQVLTLDFSDASKFRDGHDLRSTVSNSTHEALTAAIKKVTGLNLVLEFT